jgi:hypothetical protein
MKTASLLLAAGITTALFSSSCKDDDTIFCTEEFRTIGVYVEGGPLDDWYTERASNGEVIRPDNSDFVGTYHVVLDDLYTQTLKGKTETFHFIGVMQNQEVVRGTFQIGADDCHIFKVSGPDTLRI